MHIVGCKTDWCVHVCTVVRILVDDWMEHYRIAVGFASPALLSVRDTPSYSLTARNIKSARQSDHGLLIRRAVLGVEDYDETSPRKKGRIPSAPLGTTRV